MHVRSVVEKQNSLREELAEPARKRFVKVAPPTVHAGVGNALRQAFQLDGELRSLRGFEDLLAQLD
jgi:hypothetical protein